jgi:predicted murein hydrolase (TIGR00659 family)
MKSIALTETWVYLSASPLLGLTLTLLAYQFACWLFKRSGQQAWANPLLVSILIITVFLTATGIPYLRYFEGAQFVHFLLGPATVALAVPLFSYWKRLKRMALPLIVALLAGSATAAFSAMAIAKALGASPETIYSLAPKSVTTPIAMGIAEQIGGQASLAAVFVLLTGLSAIVLVGPAMRIVRVTDMRAQGLAAGMAGHGLATARMLLVNETAGAFGGLAIGLNGVITSILVPLLATFLRP